MPSSSLTPSSRTSAFRPCSKSPKRAQHIRDPVQNGGASNCLPSSPELVKSKQPFRIQIEAANRLPLALMQFGQPAKHGGAVLRVIMGYDLAHRLVIGDDTRWRRVNAKADRLAVHLDAVTKLNTLSDVRRLVVDRDAALP
jgi:hypothetical protein